MPPLIWSQQALDDVRRLYHFLQRENPTTARTLVGKIRGEARLLAKFPEAGRPVIGLPGDFRELIILLGRGAYVLRYRLEQGRAVILCVRHSREADF